MLPDELAVEVHIGVIIDRPEAQECAFAWPRVGSEAPLVPDQPVIVAHLGRVGQERLRKMDRRRAVHVELVERPGVAPHRFGHVEIAVAPCRRRRIGTVKVLEAGAVLVRRPGPGAVEVDGRTHVGADQSLGTCDRSNQAGREKNGSALQQHSASVRRSWGIVNLGPCRVLERDIRRCASLRGG